MNLTITNRKPGKLSQYSSKYAPIYELVDQALKDGRELVLDNFETFKDAYSVYTCVRRYYSKDAYIGFSKYSEYKNASPKITISPRRA